MSSAEAIKVGVLVTSLGPLAAMGEDALRGVALALNEFGGCIGDRPIQVIKEGTNAVPDTAYYAAEKLIDHDRADIVIGPLAGSEGIAVRDFAKTRPDHTFINGTSGTQDMTLRDPAPNFFCFCTNGVQMMAGLGTYAFETRGYRRVATLGQDYSFPHGQIGAFMIDYYRAGGRVAQKFWVPLGTTDYNEVISAMPSDIDAILVVLAGVDAVNFLGQYQLRGGELPLLAGTSTIDQSILSVKGALLERVVGTISAGPTVDDNPAPCWQDFVKAYQESFPEALASPSVFAFAYYVNTKAAFLGLQAIDGDLSGDQARYRAVLSALEFETPTGPVRLDHNRNAIANNFIRMVDRRPDGRLYNKLVKTIPQVNQTLGMLEDEYLAIGILDRDNPPC